MLTLARRAAAVRPFDGAVNRLVEGMFDEFPSVFQGSSVGVPRADLFEDKNSIHAQVELPGYTMEDIEVLVHHDVLILRGQRKESPREEISAWRLRERTTGAFERSFQLPYEVDHEKVEATLKAGILHIVLPMAPSAQPRKIAVKAISESS